MQLSYQFANRAIKTCILATNLLVYKDISRYRLFLIKPNVFLNRDTINNVRGWEREYLLSLKNNTVLNRDICILA